MHVDAYRLSNSYELDDLDLDAAVADSITVVEWGQGIAEGLAEDRLEIDIWIFRPTPRRSVMTASGWSRSGRSAPGGVEWTSACCAVMIMTDAPLVLALDTSTVVNVGLARGDRVLATATVADQMAHAEQLMPLVSECLDVAGYALPNLTG